MRFEHLIKDISWNSWTGMLRYQCMESRYQESSPCKYFTRRKSCIIDWVRSSNFISWLLYNRCAWYAYATCETVNKSSKSKNICYIDSNPNICFICKNENKRSFLRIRYNVMTRHRLGAACPGPVSFFIGKVSGPACRKNCGHGADVRTSALRGLKWNEGRKAPVTQGGCHG